MMINRYIIRKFAAILALTVTTAFMLVACAKEPKEPTVITMTTKASEVKIYAAGAKDIAIAWGDGKKSNVNDASFNDFSGLFEFSHGYSGTTAYNIVITGNVTRLDCSNNQLIALDVSSNTELTELYCSKNQLTVLDVSSNMALTDLDCRNNPLTALDVRKNTALKFLGFGGNPLTSLDVSRNTALIHLYCIDTPITNLDVSANTALTDLHACSTQITKLDVSKNTALKVLCVRRNRLTASALNDIFRALPEKKSGGGAIDTSGNPGTSDCDHSILEEKGWVFANLHR